MNKVFQANPFIIFTLCVYLQVACHSTPPVGVETHQNSENKNNLSSLRKQVESFAEGEGNEAAYTEFLKLPRNTLISDLEKLKKQIDGDDALQVRIAFLLCRLNYRYEENQEKIGWALARNSPYDKLPPDEVIGFASKLISLGDTQLLRVVMAASEWSDGALSEGIADILYRAITNDFDAFLRDLKSLTPSARLGVYTQIDFAFGSSNDKAKLKRNLKAKSKDKKLGLVAREMLQKLS